MGFINSWDEIYEQERIKLALEAEARNAEKTLHLFNRAYVLNQPVFEELHPQLKSLSEASSEREAQAEIDEWELQKRL